MNYSLHELFVYYGLSTVITAIISAVITVVLKKFFGKKSERLFNYLPTVISMVLELAFDMIFISKRFCISENALAEGLVSGSLATVITVLIARIKRGEVDDAMITAVLVALESLSLGDKKFSVATKVLDIVLHTDCSQVEEAVVKYLTENSGESKTKIKNAVESILQTVKKIK